MIPGRLDLTISQGATFDDQFIWESGDGVAYNLTGFTARLQIRATKDDSTTLVSLTNGAGLTLGGIAGTIDVLLSATTTAALSFTTAFWDLELVSGGGVVYRLLEGYVTLSKEVTR